MRRVLAFPTFLLLTLTSIALVAAPGVRAAPQPDAPRDAAVAPAAFSAPVRVATGSFYELAEVVDSTNHVHIAAVAEPGSVWYITDRSGAWIAHKILSNTVNVSYDTPLIAIDEQDRVYIAATKLRGPDVANNVGVFYVTDKGRTRGTFPSTATQLAPAGKWGTSLRVGNGHIYLTMEYGICCVAPDWPPAWFRTNASGSWVTTKLGTGWGPSMRLAANGHPRIVWSGQNGLEYAVAATATGSFSTTKIPHTTGNDSQPILSLAPQGYSAVAWLNSAGVRYSSRKSGSWSAAVTVPTTFYADPFSFDIDTLGRPHIVVVDNHDDSLRDVRLAGSTWTSSTIAGPVSVNDVSVRRAFSGRVVVAWATDSGIYVSKG